MLRAQIHATHTVINVTPYETRGKTMLRPMRHAKIPDARDTKIKCYARKRMLRRNITPREALFFLHHCTPPLFSPTGPFLE